MAIGNPHIDYFSLDIEGAELMILKTLPNFEDIKFTLLDIEVNHAGVVFPGSREEINKFLESRNFTYIRSVKIDDIYLNQANNRF